MEARNFRIGNLVEGPGGFTRIVERLDELSVIDGLKISPLHLTGFGFVEDCNGIYWKDLGTHHLELIASGGYWHPVYVQEPEITDEDEHRVSTNRIEFVHELQNLFFALTGTELDLRAYVEWERMWCEPEYKFKRGDLVTINWKAKVHFRDESARMLPAGPMVVDTVDEDNVVDMTNGDGWNLYWLCPYQED